MEASAGFHEGQKIWVIGPDGVERPAIYVGEGENASWFGGPPLAYVVSTKEPERGLEPLAP